MSMEKKRKEVVNEAVTELKDTINSIHDEIIEKRVNSRLPLGVFKEYFLPYFDGTMDVTEDNGIIYKWIEYSGSPHAPMDIVDEKGVIVDTIPPITNDITMNETINNMALASIGDTYNKKKNISPNVANNYLDTLTNTIKANIIVKDRAFKRKIEEYNSNKSLNGTTPTPTEDDDLLYD